MTTDISAFESLPYTKLLKRDEDGEFVASIAEFPGCSAHGATENEALEFLREVTAAWIEERLAAGLEIPKPQQDESLPSGKWLQRVSRSLHHALIGLAKAEKVSLNQLVTTILAEATARRRAIPILVDATAVDIITDKYAIEIKQAHFHQDVLARDFGHWNIIGGETPLGVLHIAEVTEKIIAKRGKSTLPNEDVWNLEPAHHGR